MKDVNCIVKQETQVFGIIFILKIKTLYINFIFFSKLLVLQRIIFKKNDKFLFYDLIFPEIALVFMIF